MSDKRIKLEELKNFCEAALKKAGMIPEYAAITAEALAHTDGYGTHSHGTKNLHNYIKKARAGGININAKPEIIKDGPAFAVMDACNCMGMIPSVLAMELACQKAGQSGIGIVTVKNSNHFGAAGYYANIAARQGMLGLVFSNVDPNMNAPGAREKALGNNPIAYACPSKTYPSVFLDIAMSNIASLHVFQARADGRKVPMNWIVDKDGLPTDDPSNYPNEGAMQPMAGHKGYGLALMVDVLTGLLSGGATSMGGLITSWVLNLEVPNNVCHTFIAVNASMFCDENTYSERVEKMASQLRNLPKAKGSERIYLPGEMEWERYANAEKDGIKLSDDLLQSLEGLAKDSDLELPLMQ